MAVPQLRVQNTLNPNSTVFKLPLSAAEHSGVIRMVLKDFNESGLVQTIIPITINVSDEALAKVFRWITHWRDMPKANDDDFRDVPAHVPSPVRFTDWDVEFFHGIDQYVLFEMLIAANYLEIKPLCDMCVQVVADMIRGKRTEEIRVILGLESDFVEEEEKAVRRELEGAFDRF